MGHKAKVRFFARSNGTDAELFSVRELSDGGLHLTLRHSTFYEDGSGYGKIAQYRLSVHRSLDSTGRTVTTSIVLGDGRVVRSVAYVECGESPFAWSLFARRHPRFDHPYFTLPARAKDTLIQVAPNFDPDLNNLITHVVVTDRRSDGPAWNDAVPCASFRHFAIFVLPAFFPAPSIDKGDTVYFLTSPSTIGDRVLKRVDRQPGETLSWAALAETADLFNAALLKKFRDRVARGIEADGSEEGDERMQWLARPDIPLSHTPFVGAPSTHFAPRL